MISDVNRLETAGKNGPKYARICREIENGIASGHYSGQLPGVTLLAQHYKVNPLTVSKALECLADQGIVEIIPRIGTFVKSKNRIAVLALSSEEDFRRSNSDHSFPAQPVMDMVLAGVSEYLSLRRCGVLAHSVSVSDHDFIRFILGEVDGVIVLSGRNVEEKDYEIFAGSAWIKVLGLADSPRQAHHVTYDNGSIGEIAADYLLGRNCRRYCYFGGRNHVYAQRYERFAARLAAAGHEAEIIELDIATLTLDVLMSRAFETMRRLPGDGQTGIFLSSSSYVVPVYQLLYALNITPVREMPLITCENIIGMLHGVIPTPPVIDLRIKEIGRHGGEMLMQMIKNPRPAGTFDKVIYTPQLLEGRYLDFELNSQHNMEGDL